VQNNSKKWSYLCLLITIDKCLTDNDSNKFILVGQTPTLRVGMLTT